MKAHFVRFLSDKGVAVVAAVVEMGGVAAVAVMGTEVMAIYETAH